MKINIKVFCKLILSVLVAVARYTQSTHNNKFAISLQYLKNGQVCWFTWHACELAPLYVNQTVTNDYFYVKIETGVQEKCSLVECTEIDRNILHFYISEWTRETIRWCEGKINQLVRRITAKINNDDNFFLNLCKNVAWERSAFLESNEGANW